MSALREGLLTTSEVAAYFRIRHADVVRMVQEDGLPAIELPGKTRPLRKYSPTALHGWLVRHSKGQAMSLEEFLRELSAVTTVREESDAERRVA